MKSAGNFVLTVLLAMAAQHVMAAPAYPGKILKTMADGTTTEVYLRGDEWVHYYESADGQILYEQADGRLQAEPNQWAARLRLEQQWAARQDLLRQQTQQQTVSQNSLHQLPGRINRKFPTTGEVKGLVILAEYQDVKFSTPEARDIFDDMANKSGYDGPYASGSVYDYFVAQSGGLFTPQFVVTGPVTLPHNRRYYGETERAAEMIEDACKEAKTAGVDFSQFDVNDDGTVDFVFVVFAGYGESQGGPTECIWPKMLDMTYETWTTFDNLFLGVAACTCELHGNTGATIDGVGTFCHEFSHILGLPDVYDTGNIPTGMGMMAWDVMDIGMYNNDTRTPSGYTAMDRFTVGWLTPKELKPGQNLQLTDLATTGEAYFLMSPDDDNEYYTLENRQQKGWDEGLPAHGLIVSHIHYVPSIWSSNRVNTVTNGTYEHIELVPADGNKSASNYAGDPFPGSKGAKNFNASSWHTTDTRTDWPITNISEENGIVCFDYRASEAEGIQDIRMADRERQTGTGNAMNRQQQDRAFDLAGRTARQGKGLKIVNSRKVIAD